MSIVESASVPAAPVDVTPPAARSSRAETLARFLDGLPEIIVAGSVGLCAPLMILLLAGHFTRGWTVPFGVAGAAVAIWVVGLPRVHNRPAMLGYPLAAVAFVVAWFAYNVRYTAQDVYATRDPATYTIAGRWLVDHASLVIHAHPEIFGSPPGATIASGSFAQVSPQTVDAQGNHLLPALLGFFGSVFGTGTVFRLNVAIAALALLVFFGLVRRFVNAPVALLAMATMALSMPYIYVSRDAFTEPLTMLFLTGSLLLLHRAFGSWRLRDFVLAGLAAGSAAMVRIDSYLALIGLVAAAAVFAAMAPPARRREAAARAAALLAGAVATALLGWLDLVWLARQYYGVQRHNILASIGVVAATVIVAIPVVRLLQSPRPRAWLGRDVVRRRIAGSTVCVLIGVFAVLVSRPLWLITRGAFNVNLVNMQIRWHAPVDGTRTYNEQTVNWLALYFGWPTIVLAVAGYSMLIIEMVRRRAYVFSGVLSAGLCMSALYLWNAEITPDQPWALRRYIPVVLPLLLLAAGWALRWLWQGRPRIVVRALALALAAYGIWFAFTTANPMRHVREEKGQLAQLTALCTAVGPDGAVIEIDDQVGFGYGQSLRSFCNVPAIELTNPTLAQLDAVNTSVVAHGRRLFVLSQITTTAQMHLITEATGLPATSFSTVTVQRWPNQINVAPTVPDSQQYSMFLASVDANGGMHLVAPVTGGS